MNKRGFEFSFAWMFAIIVGTAIIFMAVYAATKLIGTGEKISDTETGKQIGILLNPIESSIEEGKSATISLVEEAEIRNICNENGNFGSQKIKVGEGVASTFYNKYIFSEDEINGRELHVFSMPLKMPFKVADTTIIYSDKEKYCFTAPPNDIKKEIESLGLANINISASKAECASEAKTVCFSGEDCDINVFEEYNSIEKDGERIYYESRFGNALLYGAIFSSDRIYECQLKRLLKRTSELSLIYLEKGSLVYEKECISDLEQELMKLSEVSEIDNSQGLTSVVNAAMEVESKNDGASCKLF